MSSKKNNGYEFKSEFLKQLVSNKNQDKGELKDFSKINLSRIVEYILKGASIQDIENICKDINSGYVKVGMDAGSVDLIIKNQDNDNIKKLLQDLNTSMSIDVNGLSELSSENFSQIQSMGCIIDKVYVNSGYDVAAARGYDANVYTKIITKAERMVDEALSKLPEGASEEDRFMAIYNVVLKNTVYDYEALKSKGDKRYTSRNLEGFFIDGTSVCAGTADVLKQLCKMNGIEAEYVQGDAKSKWETRSCKHAWVKVMIGEKWFNVDPTWDANKVGKPYEFCLRSDKDFKGHELDKEYNPSYVRNSDGRSISRAEKSYHTSYESLDRSYLEKKYYNDELARKSGGRALTEDEINALDDMPNAAAAMAEASSSIIEIIINAILNFGRWSKSKVDGLFKSNKISTRDIETLSTKSMSEVESFAKEIHVDTEKSPEASGRVKENQKKNGKEISTDDGPEL